MSAPAQDAVAEVQRKERELRVARRRAHRQTSQATMDFHYRVKDAMARGEFEEAYEHFAERFHNLSKVHSSNVGSLVNWQFCAVRTGHYEECVAICDATADMLLMMLNKVFRNQAIAFRSLGKLEDARESLVLGQKFLPDCGVCRDGLIKIDYELAEQRLHAAGGGVQAAPKHPRSPLQQIKRKRSRTVIAETPPRKTQRARRTPARRSATTVPGGGLTSESTISLADAPPAPAMGEQGHGGTGKGKKGDGGTRKGKGKRTSAASEEARPPRPRKVGSSLKTSSVMHELFAVSDDEDEGSASAAPAAAASVGKGAASGAAGQGLGRVNRAVSFLRANTTSSSTTSSVRPDAQQSIELLSERSSAVTTPVGNAPPKPCKLFAEPAATTAATTTTTTTTTTADKEDDGAAKVSSQCRRLLAELGTQTPVSDDEDDDVGGGPSGGAARPAGVQRVTFAQPQSWRETLASMLSEDLVIDYVGSQAYSLARTVVGGVGDVSADRQRVTASVRSSRGDEVYRVAVSFKSDTRDLVSSSCNCARGTRSARPCKHVGALLRVLLADGLRHGTQTEDDSGSDAEEDVSSQSPRRKQQRLTIIHTKEQGASRDRRQRERRAEALLGDTLHTFRVDKLRTWLRANGAKVSGNKADLVRRVAKGIASGVDPRCPQCEMAQLRRHGQMYECPGYWSREQKELVFCGFQSNMASKPWAWPYGVPDALRSLLTQI